MIDRDRYNAHMRAVFLHYRERYPDERRDWHMREYEAQSLRAPLEWGNDPFWRNGHSIWKYHFAHVSTEDPTLVAYTPDDQKGERNIQVKIKPGRYLKEFFSATLNEKEVAYYAAMHARAQKPRTPWDDYEFGLATTRRDIADVYIHGPNSCMDGRYFKALRTHPCQVYAAGDLAIAYLRGEAPPNQRNRERNIVARAIVWPEKKVYSRIYPTPDHYRADGFLSPDDAIACQNALLKKLQAEGYAPGSLDGARLLKMPRKTVDGMALRNGVYMPFIDGKYKVTDQGEFLVLDKNGDFYPGNQNGAMDLHHPIDCGKCGANVPERSAERIYTRYHAPADYFSEDYWCDQCYPEHAFRCDGLRMLLSKDLEHEEIEGQGTYSHIWLRRNARTYGLKWSGSKDKAVPTKRKRASREDRVEVPRNPLVEAYVAVDAAVMRDRPPGALRTHNAPVRLAEARNPTTPLYELYDAAIANLTANLGPSQVFYRHSAGVFAGSTPGHPQVRAEPEPPPAPNQEPQNQGPETQE